MFVDWLIGWSVGRFWEITRVWEMKNEIIYNEMEKKKTKKQLELESEKRE